MKSTQHNLQIGTSQPQLHPLRQPDQLLRLQLLPLQERPIGRTHIHKIKRRPQIPQPRLHEELAVRGTDFGVFAERNSVLDEFLPFGSSDVAGRVGFGTEEEFGAGVRSGRDEDFYFGFVGGVIVRFGGGFDGIGVGGIGGIGRISGRLRIHILRIGIDVFVVLASSRTRRLRRRGISGHLQEAVGIVAIVVALQPQRFHVLLCRVDGVLLVLMEGPVDELFHGPLPAGLSLGKFSADGLVHYFQITANRFLLPHAGVGAIASRRSIRDDTVSFSIGGMDSKRMGGNGFSAL